MKESYYMLSCFLNIIFVATETAFLFLIGHIFRALICLFLIIALIQIIEELKRCSIYELHSKCKQLSLYFKLTYKFTNKSWFS